MSHQASDTPVGFSPSFTYHSMQHPVNMSPTFPSHSYIPIPTIATLPLVDLTNTTATTDKLSASISPPSNSSPAANEKKPSKFLKALADKKKSNLLFPIDRTKLLSPQDVVEKYPQFLFRFKLPTLAVKLCKESFFGKAIMSLHTVQGTSQFHALPETTLKELKLFMIELCVPRITPTCLKFEVVWKSCIKSVGQTCKAMRNSQNSN